MITQITRHIKYDTSTLLENNFSNARCTEDTNLNKYVNSVVSLNYVAAENISATTNCDPIFKTARFFVNGAEYRPDDFIIICRDTVDGVRAIGIVEKNKEILAATYNALLFEKLQVKKGGSKKGFLKTARKVDEAAFTKLEEDWNAKYANNESNVMVLNDGLDFVPTASTSVEMQLNETKTTNNELICSLFNLSPDVVSGKATAEQNANAIRAAIVPIIIEFQTALNKTLLFEREKSNEYFSIDMSELLKGDILKRYNAYKIGLDSNFLQLDEIRYKEDLKPLGFNFMKLGLDSVLLDPKTNTVYTANTNQWAKLGEAKIEGKNAQIGLTGAENRGIVEERYNQNHDDKGRFAESGISPSDANDFTVKGFKDKQKLNNHWKDHKSEYAGGSITSASEYEARAVALVESPTGNGILGHIDKSRAVIRYDTATNDFVKGSVKKGVFTMFRPEDGQTYYDNQRKRDIENGGKA